MQTVNSADAARRAPRRRAIAMLAGAVALGLTAASAMAHDAPKPDAKAEAQLAKMLDGRVAGAPVDCISLSGTQQSTIIPHTAIVYENGGTLYVNRPNGAETLDDDDILVTKIWGSQLCRLDIVHLVDRGSRMDSGFVGLESFVPYARVPKDGAHGH